ncbi:ImmA/IrrE family metallo-endopeptidase [Pediococcus ethanolidurans]|uniref:IrrE N-terminal-like domain-containing protein n=1 Tax=Pediococcus ethanolidurans TaxID=319653 RepID=A0A0R2JZZ2_9LACO|nr:ImmA/IrrE family metallo-endopeptidase [Pediococcus ethanolidurans]KRN82865.1 hypothetical protein IV87_GL001815 [Pediococcus ethanolidurans]GEN94726.1 hypothetical protein PET01_07760 [Pediococcus ethanolidurans]SER18796.1 hypothetical protein SAMN04487973_102183 [Pediococcus ethanolidurans]
MDRIDEIMKNYPELKVEYVVMDNELGGYIYRNIILLDANKSEDELVPILYEELGHYETTVGDISRYSSQSDLKQEYRARVWGLKHLVTKSAINHFKKQDYDDDYEVADELGIKITYLHEAGEVYKIKEN